MTGPGAHGLELRGEGPRDLHGVHGLAGNPELARIHTRQVEEIGRELRQPLDLPLHRGQEPAPRLVVEVLVCEQLQESAQ